MEKIKIGDLVKIDPHAKCYFLNNNGGFEVQGFQFGNSVGVVTKINKIEAEIFIDKEVVLVNPLAIQKEYK